MVIISSRKYAAEISALMTKAGFTGNKDFFTYDTVCKEIVTRYYVPKWEKMTNHKTEGYSHEIHIVAGGNKHLEVD